MVNPTVRRVLGIDDDAYDRNFDIVTIATSTLFLGGLGHHAFPNGLPAPCHPPRAMGLYLYPSLLDPDWCLVLHAGTLLFLMLGTLLACMLGTLLFCGPMHAMQLGAQSGTMSATTC